MNGRPDEPIDWNQVGAAFTALGDQIQSHFANLGKGTPQTAAGEGQAFEDVGRQLDEALTSFRNAVSDPAVGDAAKNAGQQLFDALKSQLNQVADTVQNATGASGRPTDQPAELPPVDVDIPDHPPAEWSAEGDSGDDAGESPKPE